MKNYLIKTTIILLLCVNCGSCSFLAKANGSIVENGKTNAINAVLTAVAKLLPSGWDVESMLDGMLSRDSTKIYIIVLTNKINAAISNRQNGGNRKLIIIADKNNNFRILSSGDKVLRCATCYGINEGNIGGFPNISFDRDVITICESGGSREMWGVTLRFCYDYKIQRFKMIAKKIISNDRISHVRSLNVVDYKKMTQTIINSFINNQGVELETRKKQKIGELQHFLEDYNFEFEDQP